MPQLPSVAAKRSRIGQRMAALGCARLPREIVIEMRIARAGNVAALVRRAPGRRIRQREAAIDDDPVGSAEAARAKVSTSTSGPNVIATL